MRFKKFTAVILIIMLLMIPIQKAEAIAPAIGPAIYYGVASLLVASGVYAATDEDLQYLVNDYWNRTSDNIKYRWQQAKLYAGVAGYLLIDKNIIGDMTDYLVIEKNINSGNNVISEATLEEAVIGGRYRSLAGYYIKPEPIISYGDYTFVLYYNGTLHITKVLTNGTTGNSYNVAKNKINDSYLFIEYIGGNTVIKLIVYYKFGQEIISLQTIEGIIGPEGSIDYPKEHKYTGDAAGIGSALQPDQEIKVPVPPLPETEWDPGWITELEKELNTATNPGVKDQTKIDEGNHEYEWYVDEDGNIYKVKKGQQPKKDTDRKIGPLIPPPMPDIPKHYPDVNNPDEVITEFPPEIDITINPDGTTTERTTETSTTERTWYDPDTKRWITTETTTTTRTTQDYDPDGLPLGPPVTTTETRTGPRTTTMPPQDDNKIDWDKLKLPLFALTEKFPFSLPWDLFRGIQSLSYDGSEWDRKFLINVNDGIWPEMEIDLSQYDNIAQMTRIVLLIVFDFGLILATRRLMGGDV